MNYHIGRVFLVRCVLEIGCGSVGVVSVLQAEVLLQPAKRITLQPKPTTPNPQHTSKQEHTNNVVIQHNGRKLLMLDILMSETC